MNQSPIAFLALGDIHLDDLIWRKHREITGDARVAFTSFVDLGIAFHAPLVILGDLFDTTEPPSSLVEFFRLEMERCRDAGVKVYAIQGNHDKRTVPWYVAASSWPVHVGDGKQHCIGNLNVAGLDYAGHDEIQTKLAELATAIGQFEFEKEACLGQGGTVSQNSLVDVLVLHQALKQALKFEGAWNCDLDWVPKEIPLVLLGDLHNVHRVQSKREAWYSGGAHPRSLDEIGPKSCLVVHADLTVEQAELDYRDFRRFWITPDASAAGQAATIVEWAEESLANDIAKVLPPVVWLSYTGDQSKATCDIADNLRLNGVIAVLDPISSKAVTATAESVTNDLPGLPAMLARHIDPQKNQEAYNLALALIDPTADMKNVLTERRGAFQAKLSAGSR